MEYEDMRKYYSQLEDQLQSYIVQLQKLMIQNKELRKQLTNEKIGDVGNAEQSKQ